MFVVRTSIGIGLLKPSLSFPIRYVCLLQYREIHPIEYLLHFNHELFFIFVLFLLYTLQDYIFFLISLSSHSILVSCPLVASLIIRFSSLNSSFYFLSLLIAHLSLYIIYFILPSTVSFTHFIQSC